MIDHFKRPAIVTLFLLGVFLFSGDVGAFSQLSNHLLGCIVMVVLFSISRQFGQPFDALRNSRVSLAGIALTATAAIMILVPIPLLWLPGSILFAIASSLWIDGEMKLQYQVLGLATILFFVVRVLLFPLSALWILNVNSSLVLTNKIAAALGLITYVGPSVSGWWVCSLLLFYFIARFIFERSFKKIILGTIATIGTFVIFNLVNMLYPLVRYHSHSGLNIIDSQLICFGIAAVSIILLCRKELVGRTAVIGKTRLPVMIAVQILILLALATYYCAEHNGTVAVAKGQVVIFGTTPSANYDVPSFDRFGTGNTGMYGLFPRYLSAQGYDVKTVGTSEQLDEIIGKTSVLVVICPPTAFPADTQNRIWKFVTNGGSLLVMGDHTDIFGTKVPLDRLLEPIGVKLNFDSAYPGRKLWRFSYEGFPHPITRSLDAVNEKLQYGTGASLSISSSAYPIITGKYAFSDKGNYLNGGSGAYQGDELYHGDEQLGDVVLVAGSDYGRGKVLVFGDTSMFQNIALPHSYQFLFDVFNWLSSNTLFRSQTLLGLSAVFTLLAAGIFVMAGQDKIPAAITITGTTFTLGLFILAYASTRDSISNCVPPKDRRIAYVDASHMGDFKLQHWEEESIDGLLVNLSRNGYLPFVMMTPSQEWLKASEIYVSISPLRPYSTGEQQSLEEFVRQGGKAILAVGYEESSASQDLLARLGFRIDSVPLGAAPITDFVIEDKEYEQIKQQPHFANAWPVIATDQSPTQVLYSYEGFPLVVSKKLDKGTLIVVGDGRFFRDKALETEVASWPGNVNFLKQLLGN